MITKKNGGHSFSFETKSKHCIKRISFQHNENGYVFFEGVLGELKNVALIEGLMLEIEGANGTLKIDITQKEVDMYFGENKPATQGGKNQ
ncbi:MAG: hypothetical protein ABSD92_13155 [Candidatus Bathyarchaeia archaeon]|jgi:hypothetical protein